jgi:hypothetical protein
VNHFYTLIRVSFQILGTDEKSVESAFAWMKDAQDDEVSDGLGGTPADTTD